MGKFPHEKKITFAQFLIISIDRPYGSHCLFGEVDAEAE